MKNMILIACMFITVHFAISQTFSVQSYDHASMMVYKYSITGNDKSFEQEVFYRKKLMTQPDILFCMIDLTGSELVIISKEGFDSGMLTEKFAKRGYTVSGEDINAFDEDMFLQYYCRSDAERSSVTNEHLPQYIRTGDQVKDDKNYAKAKEIWMKKFPDAYNNMIEKKPLTIEEKLEQEKK
ncbi:MAG: hypothetical protein ABIJ97_15235 [Bacteroidota bacterium]